MGDGLKGRWVIDGYVAFIAIWMVERVLFFDRWWPFALLNTIAEYLFVPLPILLVWGIWRRERPLLLKLILPISTFIFLFGELFLPSLPLLKSVPPETLLEEITDKISFGLIDLLAAEYPYHTLSIEERNSGVGLLSRYPIEQVEWLQMPPMHKGIEAVVNIEGLRVHVFVVHLSPNQFFERPLAEFVLIVKERYGQRASEIAWLQERIATDEPVLLMCDCNLTDTSETHAQMSHFLQDSFREAGWGFGHTLQPPGVPEIIQRIDYVWHSTQFEAVAAFVGEDGNSDHLPTVARLAFVGR